VKKKKHWAFGEGLGKGGILTSPRMESDWEVSHLSFVEKEKRKWESEWRKKNKG